MLSVDLWSRSKLGRRNTSLLTPPPREIAQPLSPYEAMTIKARFSPESEDAVPTIQWLQRTGLSRAETWKQVHDIGVIEIQLLETPSVLSFLSQVEDALSISRVTSEGVVFYLTDIPLWMGVPEGKPRAQSDHSDGHLFVPMSNVVCINTFGSIYARQPTV